MRISNRRGRAIAAAIIGCAAGALALTAGVSSAATARPAAGSVVIVNCGGQGVVRPSQYDLACTGGAPHLTKLHWVSWKGVTFGSGTEVLDNCLPNCVSGKSYSYPVLITLWRARTWTGHGGKQDFTRMTLIETGSLRFPPSGHLPLTPTYSLPPVL
jgi:hypothetical protein